MMEIHEMVSLERSLGMAPLSVDAQRELVEMCSQLLRERAQLRELIGTLPEPVGELRAALNELHRLLR